MMYSFDRGKLNTPSGRSIPPDQYFINPLTVVPNMDLTERTHQAYLDMAALAKKEREANIKGTYQIAHMNFLRRVVEWNYYYDREEDTLKWMKVCLELYPQHMTAFTGYNPKTDTYDLDKFVLNRLKDAVGRGGIDKTYAILIGLLIRHFTHLAMGEEEEAVKHLNMAEDLHKRYTGRFSTAAENRVNLPEFSIILQARKRVFMLEHDPVIVARLRTVLGMKKDELPPLPGN
jgi:hypothetical protein